MDVLVTGANGTVGSAILEHLADPELAAVDDESYSFTCLDVRDHPERETVVADVADYDAIRPAFEGVDAVIHLAVFPSSTVDDAWDGIQRVNVRGTRNVLRAAADAGVESVIFASTNHVMGMYEDEFAPELYDPDFDLALDHTDPVRPDSTYGVSKLFGEQDGRFFVETEAFPKRFYAIRICSVRDPEYDHPYGDAEKGVDDGDWERGSDAYERQVARLKATWFSRRDCAHMVDRCLQDDTVEYGIFSGVSDNDGRWFDVEHATDELGYEPRDDGAEWDEPPSA